ncbi:MAG TPA: kelch repeat-containing protein, partial [Planctomycetota bacterium]|nr:kelch repeat-containing protein [Planctomycetota bacterium]
MARNGLVSNLAAAALVGGALALAGCGGGGSSGGVDRPPAGYELGNVPTVFKLQTPLGLSGTRGSGPDVFVALNLKDREFNRSDVQMEYGYDVNGDGQITPSPGDPTTTDEFFPCTRNPNLGESLVGMDTAGGKAGADHLFVWNSVADVPGARFVTLDYDYSPQGRPQNGSDGLPLFVNTPGIKLRARANDGGGDPSRWGPWNTTVAFDLNNNSQPTVNIDETIGLFGVTPNATGTAADENVVLNLRFSDNDSDLMAVSVDWAQVPEAAFLGDPNVVAALQWFPATTFAGTADTNLPSSPGLGTAATYSWDSVADAGTVNGRFILRATPFDAKSELGPTVTMDDGLASLRDFRLDNYTIFTDPATALSQGRVGHRVTTLANDRVLITGGRTTTAGASVATAELFFPGIGETTLGAVAATAPMATARSFHSQTRLFDDRVLVVGGFSAAGGVLNSVEIYDPVAGTWQTLGSGSLTTARARHTASLLPNGNVLIAGGVDGAGNALNSAEIFQVSNNDSVPVAEAMTAARHSVDGVLLPNGRVLIPGGKNTAGSGLS